MNEMDLLARLRDDVPRGAVPPEAVRRLAAEITSSPPGRAGTRPSARRRPLAGTPRWRLVTAGLAAVAVAAGATVAVTLSGGGAPAPAGLTVQELAYRAATAAAAMPAIGPRQWIYRELYARPSTPFQPSGVTLQWATANNQVNAFYLHHRLIVGPWSSWAPLGCAARKPTPHPVPCTPADQHYLKFPIPHLFVSYRQLGSLPASPRPLISVLAARNRPGYVYDMTRQPGKLIIAGTSGDRSRTGTGSSASPRPGASTQAFRAFNVIAYLLATYVMPPRLTAELYRALGDLPGVRVDQRAVDVTGRHGVAFWLGSYPGARDGAEIILNPRTYQFMAFGNRQQGTAVLRQALVAGPGDRPGAVVSQG
jgi:hypothetical protein